MRLNGGSSARLLPSAPDSGENEAPSDSRGRPKGEAAVSPGLWALDGAPFRGGPRRQLAAHACSLCAEAWPSLRCYLFPRSLSQQTFLGMSLNEPRIRCHFCFQNGCHSF